MSRHVTYESTHYGLCAHAREGHWGEPEQAPLIRVFTCEMGAVGMSVCLCVCSHFFSRTVAATETKRGYVSMYHR